MNNDNNVLQTTQQQFMLSHELLALLQWMVENESPKLKKMIAKALASGLRQEISRNAQHHTLASAEDAQYSVIEFFGLLEALMLETINEQAVQNAMEKNLMPAVEHIDGSICDDATVKMSIQKASARLDQKPYADPQDTLFKELLKRWKPTKKNVLH